MDYNEPVNTEDLILNLGNPVLAEQFRIRKIVQDKFSKIEEDIKAEFLEEKRVREKVVINKKNVKTKKDTKGVLKSKRYVFILDR